MSTPLLLNPADEAASIMVAPEAVPQPSAPIQPVASAQTDTVTRGQPLSAFRPGFHRVNADGSPFRNRYGNFMPRGGRRVKTESAGQTELVRQPEAVPQLSVAAQPEPVSIPKTEPVAQPSAPAWSEVERAAAAATAPIPGTVSAPAEPQIDTSTDAADVAAEALFFSVGALFDAHEESQPPKAERDSLVRVLAAWIRSTGWRGSAGVCAMLAVLAYLLRVLRKPKASAKVQQWLAEIKGAGRAARAVPVAPSPPAQPVVPSMPAPFAVAPSSFEFVERPGR